MEPLHELRVLVARHCLAGRSQTIIPRLSLMRSDVTTPPAQGLYEPLVCFVVQGRKRVTFGSRLFDYDAAKYLIASVDLPASGEIAEASEATPYLAVALRLDPAMLAAMLIDMPEQTVDAVTGPGLTVSPVTAELIDPVLRLVRLIDRPCDIAMLAPLIEREILYRLMRGEQGATLRQIALADSRLSQVRRAIGWIKQHYDRPLRIEVLAEIARMSPSSLHRHFKAVTAMSPLQFQKRIRLQEARLRVLADEADAASIGFAVGYESPSQFNREYRRLFGAPPARDAARLRGAAVDRGALEQSL